jgi:hypothetical protein
MSFEQELRHGLDRAGRDLALDEGSLHAVKKRARQRTRRARLTNAGVAASLVVVVGLVGARMMRPDATEVTTANEGPAEAGPQGEEQELPDPDEGPAAADQVETDEVDQDDDGAPAPAGSEDDDPADTESALSGPLTEADFTYEGAFLAPANGERGFAFGGRAAAFNPYGDPSSSDGFDGSLFITGFPRNEQVAEISIPAPELHDGSTAGLPIATVLQPFSDVTGGRGESYVGSSERGGLDDFRIGGLEVIDGGDGPRLHWTAWQVGNVAYNDVAGHGSSSLDLQNPDPQGPWYLGNQVTYKTAGYLFDVPRAFADEHLGGNYLLSGFQDAAASSVTSWGPPFFAFSPPAAAEPEARLQVVELVNYPYDQAQLAGYEKRTLTPGADWVESSDGRRAIVTVGTRAGPNSGDCDSGPNQGDPYTPQLMFYDPDDLARVAAGELTPSQVEPYRTWQPSSLLFPTCDWLLSSISFDETSGRLYVVQVKADRSQQEHEPVPAVHVFSVD